jgi:copper chaperone CopZ
MRTPRFARAAAILALATSPALAGGDKRATLDVPVAGMSCEGCAAGIVRAVGALAGVVSVKADPDAARVVVAYDPGEVGEARIRAAIEKLGYVVGDADPPVAYPKGADVKTISKQGEDVRVGKPGAREGHGGGLLRGLMQAVQGARPPAGGGPARRTGPGCCRGRAGRARPRRRGWDPGT